MSAPAQFWKGKNVLITGHTGFKGAWLAEILHDLGANVTGLALPPEGSPNLFDLLTLRQRIRHLEGDIRDAALVKRIVEQVKPEIILHLAAQALVRPSYQQPVETFATNVMGTVHVLEAARQVNGVRSIVVVTSDKCYANEGTGRFFAEDDKMGGNDPYSASKGATELVAHAYNVSFFRSSGTALASARAGNVIGGGDWAVDRLIPDAVRAFDAGTPITIRYPDATRPWQHVLEPLRGYMVLAQHLYEKGEAFSGGWNFGPEKSGVLKVKDVLALLQQNLSFTITVDQGEQLHEAKTLGLDIAKAQKQLPWKPLLSAEEAIRWTGEWYKQHAEGISPIDLTRKQITEFFGRT